jgi:toxin CcdB
MAALPTNIPRCRECLAVAQFDVYRNMGASRDSVPYMVVLQSMLYDGYNRRVMIPLVKARHIKGAFPVRFMPAFTIKGEKVVLHPLEISSVAVEKLGKPVASLAEHGQKIIDALDELMSRAYG